MTAQEALAAANRYSGVEIPHILMKIKESAEEGKCHIKYPDISEASRIKLTELGYKVEVFAGYSMINTESTVIKWGIDSIPKLTGAIATEAK